MNIAIAQINCTVGDLSGNAAKIFDYAERAKKAGASILLTPELGLCGYPPEDLLLREGFMWACERELHELAARIHGISVVVGHPHLVDGKRYNAASLLQEGRIHSTYHKHRLPNHTVFDEVRYFSPGSKPCVFDLEGVSFGINICADIWHADAPQVARRAGAQVLLVINASPYHMEKQPDRYYALGERVNETGMAIVYANLLGGQDELVFDGASCALDRHGNVTHQFAPFQELMGMVTLEKGALVAGEIIAPLSSEASVYQALCLGVKDYVEKNHFPGVELGLSGGIDSALTLAIAVDALGAARVHAVMMPTQFTADMSIEDARQIAKTLGVRYSEVPIKPVFDTYLSALADEFRDLPADTTEENIQARIRGTMLMAMSNKYGSIVLTTGNKSEMAVGYATLYGDMAGGFAVLKDVQKTLVYRLAHYRNTISPVIPQRIITRAPSAELKANQTDQDALPPYDVLDAIMELYVEQDRCPQDIIAAGYAEQAVRRVVQLIDLNEYKRRQSPVGIRITRRGFGKDRRYPITSQYRPKF